MDDNIYYCIARHIISPFQREYNAQYSLRPSTNNMEVNGSIHRSPRRGPNSAFGNNLLDNVYGVRLVPTWLLVTPRPLTVAEIQCLLVLNLRTGAHPQTLADTVECIQMTCGTLVTTKGNTFDFHDASVRHTFQQFLRYKSGYPKMIHKSLVVRLLLYVKLCVTSTEPSVDIEALFCTNPLLEYATRSWLFHFERSCIHVEDVSTAIALATEYCSVLARLKCGQARVRKRDVFPFAELPRELRNEVYGWALKSFQPINLRLRKLDGKLVLCLIGSKHSYGLAFNVLRLNRTLYREAASFFYATNTFTFNDHTALFLFVENLSCDARSWVRDVTLRERISLSSIGKHYLQVFVSLIKLKNLQNFRLSGYEMGRHGIEIITEKIYENAHSWLEAVGRERKDDFAGVGLISVDEEMEAKWRQQNPSSSSSLVVELRANLKSRIERRTESDRMKRMAHLRRELERMHIWANNYNHVLA